MCKCYKAQDLPARLARRIDVQQLVKLLPERLLPEQHVNRKDQRDDAGKCKARQQLCHGKGRIKQAADALLEKFADLSEQGIPVDLHIFHVALDPRRICRDLYQPFLEAYEGFRNVLCQHLNGINQGRHDEQNHKDHNRQHKNDAGKYADRAPGLLHPRIRLFRKVQPLQPFHKNIQHIGDRKAVKERPHRAEQLLDPAKERIGIFDNQYTDHSDDCDLDPVDIYDMLQPPDLRMVF